MASLKIPTSLSRSQSFVGQRTPSFLQTHDIHLALMSHRQDLINTLVNGIALGNGQTWTRFQHEKRRFSVRTCSSTGAVVGFWIAFWMAPIRTKRGARVCSCCATLIWWPWRSKFAFFAASCASLGKLSGLDKQWSCDFYRSINTIYLEPGPCKDKFTFFSTSAGKCSARMDSRLSNLSSKLMVTISRTERRRSRGMKGFGPLEKTINWRENICNLLRDKKVRSCASLALMPNSIVFDRAKKTISVVLRSNVKLGDKLLRSTEQ